MSEDTVYKLRHKETGEFAIGTLETVQGCAHAAQFVLDHDGKLEPIYEGETDIWWEGQEPETDPMTNELILVTDDLGVYPISEFERVLVEEEDETS